MEPVGKASFQGGGSTTGSVQYWGRDAWNRVWGHVVVVQVEQQGTLQAILNDSFFDGCLYRILYCRLRLQGVKSAEFRGLGRRARANHLEPAELLPIWRSAGLGFEAYQNTGT